MDVRRTGTVESSPAQMTDEELLLEYRSVGDDELFAELVHRYERELYNYLRRYLGDAAMAQDAFQATFLQIHLKCDQFEESRRFRPWLYTIATNQAIDAGRRNRRHRLVSLDRKNKGNRHDEVGTLLDLMETDQPSPAAELLAAERREWVREAVKELPEQLRSALILVYYQGLKYREAAEVLSIPVGTVKSRLHSAILKLNEAWNASHPRGEN